MFSAAKPMAGAMCIKVVGSSQKVCCPIHPGKQAAASSSKPAAGKKQASSKQAASKQAASKPASQQASSKQQASRQAAARKAAASKQQPAFATLNE